MWTTGTSDCRLCGCHLRHHPHERPVFVCDPCLRSRRDYNPACDSTFPDKLLALFDDAAGGIVYPLHELGIAPRYRDDVKNAMRIVRRRLIAEHGDWIIGYPHIGGYRRLSNVDPLPSA